MFFVTFSVSACTASAGIEISSSCLQPSTNAKWIYLGKNNGNYRISKVCTPLARLRARAHRPNGGRCARLISEGTEVEAAIGVDHLAGAVIEVAISNCSDHSRDVLGRTHAALRQQSRGDTLFVGLFDFGDHIRAHDSRLDFEDENAFGREALGIHHARHAEARL